MAHYSKTYTSPAQLTALLQSRGLHVENVTRTENYLRHIGYYRFSAYLYPLLTTPKENHVFKPMSYKSKKIFVSLITISILLDQL